MAENNAPQTAAAPSEGEPAKKSSTKTIMIIAVIFVLEALTIGGAYLMFSGPAPAEAHAAAPNLEAEGQKLVETALVSDKFPNTRTGKTFVYDAEIFIVLQQKHRAKIAQEIESSRAQISEDIREIISRNDRSQLNEPTLATVKRQIKAKLDQRFGRDEEGKAIVEQVVIKKFTEFQI